MAGLDVAGLLFAGYLASCGIYVLVAGCHGALRDSQEPTHQAATLRELIESLPVVLTPVEPLCEGLYEFGETPLPPSPRSAIRKDRAQSWPRSNMALHSIRR